MKTKLVGFFTIFALICGDCVGRMKQNSSVPEPILDSKPEITQLFDRFDRIDSSISNLDDQVKDLKHLINVLVLERNQLKKQIKDLQLKIEKYEDSETFYDTEEYPIPKHEYNKWIHAAAEGNIKIIQAYIEKGYDANTQYDAIISLGTEYYLSDRSSLVRDFNALTVATKYGHAKILALLLKNGASINLIDPGEYTALMRACENGNEDIAQILINKEADVNLANHRGITPLMLASANGHENIVKLLLNNGADVSAKSNNGLTALDLAVANKHKKIEELLKKEGAKTTDFQDQWRSNKVSSTPRTRPVTTKSKFTSTAAKHLVSKAVQKYKKQSNKVSKK